MKKFRTSTAVMIIFICVILGIEFFYGFLYFSEKELFVFGYVFDEYVVNFTAFLCWFVSYLLIHIHGKRTGVSNLKKSSFITLLSLCAVMIGASVWGVVYNVSEAFDECRVSQRVTLSDGNELLLTEEITHSSINKDYELKYLNVYQLDGITAKRIGRVDETEFSNSCLEQGKYSYEYDENNRLLTVTCEYGIYGDENIHLKEEYDTGFLTYDFTLE